jgi:peptidoglycan/xylan/chitin deacetylase (PgdA/CDA1 family)
MTTNRPPATPGTFVISLDFELMWGVRDLQTKETYGANVLGARRAIPAMLALFEEFGLHVTWATVGLLFFGNKADLLAGLPARRPAYTDGNLSNYVALPELGPDEAADPYYYGHELVTQIAQVLGQEVATHTFSHYYCLEPGQTPEDFRADLTAAVAVATQQGYTLRSLVFPRNQYNAAYLSICQELGITSYRGNEAAWMYQKQSEAAQTPWQRAARLLDAYVSVSGPNTYKPAEIAKNKPFDIPASRFLRPWSERLAPLEGLRLRRILGGMTHAARQGEVFHLWWHPHNFGANLPQNMAVLRQIAEHFRGLQRQYGFRTQTMAELADELAHFPQGFAG